MIKSYLKIALRHLQKNKLYAFVNIIGLSIGITSCILIGMYIFHELSYDKFHANADRIVRVTMEYRAAGTVNKTAVTGTKVGPQFKRTFPAVEAFTRTFRYARVIGYGNKVFDEKNVLYADSAFFHIFSFRLLRGNRHTALSSTDNIVLTESMAKKYFGNEDAMGKTLRVSDTKDYIVSGIAADVPANSQLQFSCILPFNSLISTQEEEQWWSANYVTYLLLQQPSQISVLAGQVINYMKGVTKEELHMEGSDYLTYQLEPLKRVHLYSSLDGLEPNGSIIYVYALSIIAVLILSIACVNYTNLAIAQSTGRGTEVGIRKVMGAQLPQLFSQFLGESFLLTFIALLIGIIAGIVLLPLFNTVAGKSLSAAALFEPFLLTGFITIGNGDKHSRR
jgi:putative ABC transport system permease protein